MSTASVGAASPRPVTYPLRVFRIGEGTSAHVRLTSPRYGGLLTHWKPKRSIYCTGDDCPAALHKLNSFWKGYGAAEVWDAQAKLWLPICLELTEHLELDFRDRWARGQVWKISREKMHAAKHQPTHGEFVRQLEPSEVPAPLDLLPCLLHLYHCTGLTLDKKNPLPARTLVQPSAGAPPVELEDQVENEEERPKEMNKLKQLLSEHMGKWKTA